MGPHPAPDSGASGDFEPLAALLRRPAALPAAALPARLPAGRVALPDGPATPPAATPRVLRAGTFHEAALNVEIGAPVAREHDWVSPSVVSPVLPSAYALPSVSVLPPYGDAGPATDAAHEEGGRGAVGTTRELSEHAPEQLACAPGHPADAAADLEAALEAARAEGYAAGRAEAEAALRAEVELHKASVSADLALLEDRLRVFLSRLETDLVAVALDAAELVVGAVPPEPVAGAVGRAVAQAIEALAGGDALGVHLHPVDLLRLQEEGIVDALTAAHPGLRWAPDERLAEGDWHVFSHEAAVRRVRAELLDGLRARFDLLGAAGVTEHAPPSASSAAWSTGTLAGSTVEHAGGAVEHVEGMAGPGGAGAEYVPDAPQRLPASSPSARAR